MTNSGNSRQNLLTQAMGASLALLSVLMATGAAFSAERAAKPCWTDTTIVLEGALPTTNPGLKPDLELYLQTAEGKWNKDVLGYSMFHKAGERIGGLSWMDHEGTITVTKQDGDKTQLDVDMAIHDDPWCKGGAGKYKIEIQRGPSGAVSGSFEGVFDRKGGIAGPAGSFPCKGKVTGRQMSVPWPSPAEGYVPVQPGEHPRLLFRKADLPALRQRMTTKEGKEILEQLDMLLSGKYTLWHGCGYGLLYQLTGDKKHAEKAKEMIDLALAGTPDRDARYGLYKSTSGGLMRLGPAAAAVGLAYDMCYDAWDEGYRVEVAKKIMERANYLCIIPDDFDPKKDPYWCDTLMARSNHYGPWNGGGGLAMLAVTGDPGTDAAIVERCNRVYKRRAKRSLLEGHGTRAFFYEGNYCGRINENTGMTMYLQALRTAEGEDYVANCEAAQWLLAKWVFEWVRINGRPQCVPQGMYGQSTYEKGMLSDGGDFSMGFGVCPKGYLPGAKWCANHLFQREGDGPGWYDYTLYPHRAVCAFVNWPIDVKEANPAEAMGHILYDREADYWILRSGWGDKDITFVGRGASLTRLTADPEAGTAGGFRPPPGGPTTFHQFDTNATVLAMQWERPDGAKGQSCVAVDVSGLSGARMLLASIADMNPAAPAVEVKPDAAADAKAKDEAKGKAEFLRAMGGQKGKADGGGEASATTLQVGKAGKIVFGGREVTVVGLGAGWQAEYKVVGTGQDARILIGKRAISCDGKKLVLGLAEAN